MISFSNFALISCFVSSFVVRAAPTTVDSATLLRNGQEAQQLNTEFTCIDASDACVSGNFACIDEALAKCVNGSWQLSECPSSSESCFALPSFSNNGTVLTCATESSATSTMNASGVEGGLFGNTSDTSSTSLDDDPCDEEPVPSSSPSSAFTPASTSVALPSHSSDGTPSVSIVTITETVTNVPTSLVTLTPQTFTLNPADAAGLLSSLIAGGASIVTVIPPAPTAVPSTLASILGQNNST